MAKKTIEKFYSDLSGDDVTDGAPTLQFAFDGSSYEIDLTESERSDFEKAIAPYVAVARRRSSARSAGTRTVTRSAHDPKAVRAWANENGVDVPSRGRIPSNVVEAYEEAAK